MKSTGYIINGIYYTKDPTVPELIDKHSSTDKLYDHDRQRENHGRDLIQPWVNGDPNQQFIEQYPEEAKQYGFIEGE
jgi:hypothetical protein